MTSEEREAAEQALVRDLAESWGEGVDDTVQLLYRFGLTLLEKRKRVMGETRE